MCVEPLQKSKYCILFLYAYSSFLLNTITRKGVALGRGSATVQERRGTIEGNEGK